MNYDRVLPPIADQPFLEFRRPSHKDACFAVSALSPHLSKRVAGDWDTMSARTSLLDRYLGQQPSTPVVHDFPPTPSQEDPPTPGTPGFPTVPANPKILWALMSQRVYLIDFDQESGG
jgi:hypothetical protein